MNLCNLDPALGVCIIASFLCLYLAPNFLTQSGYVSVLPFIRAINYIILMRCSKLVSLADLVFCAGLFDIVVFVDAFTARV